MDCLKKQGHVTLGPGFFCSNCTDLDIYGFCVSPKFVSFSGVPFQLNAGKIGISKLFMIIFYCYINWVTMKGGLFGSVIPQKKSDSFVFFAQHFERQVVRTYHIFAVQE